MKLLELEVNNIRGIRNLSLKPSGKNIVIWGPNGSGKSAVVDAIDFLLTGRISRLMGKGTGNITLSKHGPHIDCTPEDATVRAIIQIPIAKETIELKRCFAQPNNLICSKTSLPYIEPLVELAKRGQHILTRREILRYITAEGSTRAQEIQELLNITEIEDVRKNLVKIQNDFTKEHKLSQRNLESAKGSINATIGKVTFQSEVVLDVINQNRAILGASAISQLISTELKTGIKLLIPDNTHITNVTLLEGDITHLKSVVSNQNKAEIAKIDGEIRSLIKRVKSNPELLKSLSQYKLTILGIQLLDETGSCPLCDTFWPPGKLLEYLKKKEEQAQVATQYEKNAAELSQQLLQRITTVQANLQKLISAVKLAGIQAEFVVLAEWQNKLNLLSDSLSALFENYPLSDFDPIAIQQLLAPDKIEEILDLLIIKVKQIFPEATPEQTAWDTLTRLDENLKAFEKAQSELEKTSFAYRRANILVEEFQHSRDAILQRLYDDIRDRFVELYKQLHSADESNFQAKLNPEGAALNLEVDFYGRGIHPPHALHSEGHQDSMGLCLYLALSEKLVGGFIDLTILDDVVMSVDAEHRRVLCRLIAGAFPNRQFLITTHDKTWATQLRSENVVGSKGSIEFYNWKVATGPQVNYEADCWTKIGIDIEKNDISSAAARLRRAAEQYLGLVCDSLQAPVKYKLNGRWELGDFLPAAIGQFRKILVKAKEAAQSWNNRELFLLICEVDTTAGQIYARTNCEQWAINANVHYNNWVNFEKQDFLPVVEAFQDLFALFKCNTCGAILYLASVGIKSATLKCDCGIVNWNLIIKEKDK